MTISDTSHGRAVDTPTNPYEPPPIGPDEVRAGVARELHALADLGLPDAVALARAVEITEAKIRNSPVLVERQAHDGRCHACGESLDGTRPEIAVMQAKGAGRLWLHSGTCHAEHSRRRVAQVDDIMAMAGYGPDGVR